MARELERSHGGVFGSLATDLQRPLAELIMQSVDAKFGKSAIEPMILTGLDALGRSTTNEAIALVFRDMAETVQLPEQVIQQLGIKWNALFKTLCAGRDVKYDDFAMTDTEIKEKVEEERAEQEKQMRLQAELNGGGGQGQPQEGGPDVPVQAPQ